MIQTSYIILKTETSREERRCGACVGQGTDAQAGALPSLTDTAGHFTVYLKVTDLMPAITPSVVNQAALKPMLSQYRVYMRRHACQSGPRCRRARMQGQDGVDWSNPRIGFQPRLSPATELLEQTSTSAAHLHHFPQGKVSMSSRSSHWSAVLVIYFLLDLGDRLLTGGTFRSSQSLPQPSPP